MKKRITGVFLTLCLLLTLLPTAAMAEGTTAKTPGTISILENPTKIYDAQAVTDPSAQTNSDGEVSCTYYEAGADGTWTALNGAPVDAGSYAVTATVAETAHYTAATTEKYPFTIAKRPVALELSTSVSGDALTAAAVLMGVSGSNAGAVDFTFTPQGGTNATTVRRDPVMGDNGVCTATATLEAMQAGTYTVTARYVSGADYESASAPGAACDKSKKTRSINCTTGAFSDTYGKTASFNLGATASESVPGDTDQFTYSVVWDSYAAYGLAPTVSSDSNNGQVTINNAGTAFIKISLTDADGNYNEADTYVKVQVNPVPLTVTPVVKNGDTAVAEMAYGTAGNMTYSLDYAGLLSGDAAGTFTQGHGTLTPETLSNTTHSQSYDLGIVRHGSGSLTIDNTSYENIFFCRSYDLNVVQKHLTVKPATPTVSVPNQTAKIGWGLSEIGIPTLAAGVNGETVPGTLEWTYVTDSAGKETPADSSYMFSGKAGGTITAKWEFTPASEDSPKYKDYPNYTAVSGSTTFTLEEKTDVAISGLSAPKDRRCNGTAVQDSDFGTPRFSPAYTGGLTYAYYRGRTAGGETIAAPAGSGSYTVRVSIPANSRDYKGYADIPFSIAKGNGVFSDVAFTPAAAQTLGQAVAIAGKLADEGGNPIAGQNIAIRFVSGDNDKTFAATTGSDGKWQLTVKPGDYAFAVGTCAVTISFAGSADYNSATQAASYTIAPAPVSGGDSSPAAANTTNTTNADGSVTRTETTTKTDSSGAVIKTETVTTTAKDGTVTKVETATTTKTDAATGAKTEVVAEAKTAADGTITKVETVRVAGGTDGVTAEAKVETGRTGEAVAAATVEAPATATTTTLPAAVVEAVTSADTANVTVKVGEVSVALDKTAVEAVKAVGGETPTLSATPVAAKNLPADLQSATKAYDFKVSGKGVNFGGGSAVVSMPYTKADSSKAVAVYHIDAAGSETRVYDVTLTAGRLNIPTAGWSTYAVLEVKPLAFTDVKESDWFCGSVAYALDSHLFKGTSAATFSPNASMTRRQMWMVLARMAGKTPATMADARNWAMASGVSDGSGGAGAVTREQFVTLLWRAAGSPAATKDMSGYTDFASVAAYARTAMTWAVETGIVSGTSDTTLGAKDSAARAQIAVILMRYGRNTAK